MFPMILMKGMLSGKEVLLSISTPFQKSPFKVAFSSLYSVHREQKAISSL